jgi:cell wall-associated NlpC family hydrolase
VTPEQRLRILEEAREWIGTPWHHEARVKGRNGGVDCVMLLCEVYERAGVLPHIVPHHYPIDVMLHRSKEVVIPYLERYGMEVESPDVGDTVVYRFGRSFSHAAIYAGAGRIVHAFRPFGCVSETLIEESALGGRPRKYFTMRVDS